MVFLFLVDACSHYSYQSNHVSSNRDGTLSQRSIAQEMETKWTVCASLGIRRTMIVHPQEAWCMMNCKFFGLALFSTIALVVTSGGQAAEIEGTVLPFKSVIVSSPVLEIIAEAPVDEGDDIKKGEVLAMLRSEQELLELTRYDQLIQQAEREYQTAKRLADSGSGTSSDRDERETELKRLQSERALVKLRLDEKTIVSPLDGIVVGKLFEAGEAVDRVEDMFEVVNIDTIFIRVYVEAAALQWLEKGAELAVRFPVMSEDEVFQSKVDFVDSRVDPASGLVRVKLLMDNPGHRIKAGMRAKVRLPDAE